MSEAATSLARLICVGAEPIAGAPRIGTVTDQLGTVTVPELGLTFPRR